jgi:hypothetical protein
VQPDKDGVFAVDEVTENETVPVGAVVVPAAAISVTVTLQLPVSFT